MESNDMDKTLFKPANIGLFVVSGYGTFFAAGLVPSPPVGISVVARPQ